MCSKSHIIICMYMTLAFLLCTCRYYYDYDDYNISSAICRTDCDGSESRLSDCNIQGCSGTEYYDCTSVIFVKCCKENN